MIEDFDLGDGDIEQLFGSTPEWTAGYSDESGDPIADPEQYLDSEVNSPF